MSRSSIFVLLALSFVIGCGTDDPTAINLPSNSPEVEDNAIASVSSPTDIVSQFLDGIRRGGGDSLAESLLTKNAQSELRRIGHSVQPIGSPDARFEVTRSETVPNEPGSVLVHTLWIEPSSDGTETENQVVWAVEQEGLQWRISGLVMALGETQPPLVLDFENGEMMAKLLANPGVNADATPQSATSQAAAPNAVLKR
ncbi:hypothetical protein OAL43_01330 [bacterium]|nr:hypothetical protein [Rhodopirellula sp.]MDB4679085.1 hypothetical protein [Rhodopirellula sp.]MDC0278826.1 hypothetical protein [bacterium]